MLFRRFCLPFLFFTTLVVQAQNPAETVNVDMQANRHDISPLIYGVNIFENPNVTAILEDLNAPLNRYGGNRASTYNWQLNSDNRGNDYFFESITDDSNVAPGDRTDTFVNVTRAAGAEPMLTIPMLDWVAKAGSPPYPCSYPIGAFPNQDRFDPDNGTCGNGLWNGDRVAGADPTVTFVANSLANQTSWVQHTTGKFGATANGGVKYYVLDNEHDLWSGTHHDAVATGPHATAERDLMLNYAAMIKAQDAGALVVGPETSGYLGYVYSPYDLDFAPSVGWDSSQFPDRQAINGSDYAPWMLSQFKAYADAHNGLRLLDVFTFHYYPQGGDVRYNTRSLWDPNYVDPSWLSQNGNTTIIQLIPRMKQWVAANYPGTKIGITEYNWGDINNEAQNDTLPFALAEVDVLGIFGREGLDLATRFNAPTPNTPSYTSMKMYRNYDGSKSTFGDVSVSAAVANPDNVAAFAAERTSDGKATVMLLSKYPAGTTAVTLNLANFAASGTAQVWQMSGNGLAIQHLSDIAMANSQLGITLPAQSATLLVISATVAQPAVSFDKSSINFGTQVIRTTTPASSLTMTNTGSAALNISNIAISGAGLSQSNNCPATLAPAANCLIAIQPTALGVVSGALTITDSAADSPETLAVSGKGDLLITVSRLTRPARSSIVPAATTFSARAADGNIFTPVTFRPRASAVAPPTFAIWLNPPQKNCDSAHKSRKAAAEQETSAPQPLCE